MAIAWKPVEPSYKTYLQLIVLIDMLILAAIGIGIYVFVPTTSWLPNPLWFGIPWVALTLFFGLFWSARRFQFTAYARTAEAMYLRRGALWRLTRAVPLNRIQHVEVRQGFIERTLGLAHLTLYTAGSGGADLSIPGLKLNDAEQMKASLVNTIADEPTEDDDHA
ncbi:PH domain-containing protein [Pseudidiomarina andamanensis]|uniref:PH domain-containing protein n=1 Tax=Pseudidiomarina andamanensis TaxID=1940690 RepID=A0AA92ETD4_9GAMM|nr:PH domain-containing protein [Pseudidiomarina andamanensis]MDS0218835.1 PH domain-containing protein [Pseudidiomarina andamanensis]QGT96202.1 PH domain-containing protein [Pseudidiomarina andamanensis]